MVKQLLVLCLTLCLLLLPASGALAAKARSIVTDADSDFHAAHLLLHLNTTQCHATGNYIKTRSKPGGSTVVGHLEQADSLLLLAIEDNWAKIEVTASAQTSPDSFVGMTGWINTDYLDCDCSEAEYWGNSSSSYSTPVIASRYEGLIDFICASLQSNPENLTEMESSLRQDGSIYADYIQSLQPNSAGIQFVRISICGVSGQIATDACYQDINGYKPVTIACASGYTPTSYCSLHKSVSICTESGLLATEHCPGTSIVSRGVVIIPNSHPLYHDMDAQRDWIQAHLGFFATLKSTSDISSLICRTHDETATQSLPEEFTDTANDAYQLTLSAYQLVGASADLSNDTRRQINTIISKVQALLSASPIDYAALATETESLRNALDAADLL